MPNTNNKEAVKVYQKKKSISWAEVWSILAILALATLAFKGLSGFVQAAEAVKMIIGVVFVAMLVKLALKA